MRFRSDLQNGYQVFAVTGINTISFAIEATDEAKSGLLGFGVVREDPRSDERFVMPGFKVFESVIPQPKSGQVVSTMEHPVQSFVWDDFTAKEDRKYVYHFVPIKGRPKKLEHGDPVRIEVETEGLFTKNTHDVFFNRGVASSQAYERKFGNRRPDELSGAKQQEALDWLSRHLDEAILAFIRSAQPGDTLLGCFYEFRYRPVAEALKAALDLGVTVKLILDGKENGTAEEESFPREANIEMVGDVDLPSSVIIWREAKVNDIQHNKFMVLLEGSAQTPKEVWTGSTNISMGGIHGQTNVGHWVRDSQVADQFRAYWEVLAEDPGGEVGDDAATTRKKNDALKRDIEALQDTPETLGDIPAGVTPIFSPRRGLAMLDLYVSLIDGASDMACITLAFGINKAFKNSIADNTIHNALTFFLLEKEDRPNPKSKDPFLFLGAKQNVYKAWGSFLREPLHQWAKETSTRSLQLNQHVAFVHSKFLLRDPLGDDPIVVSGSANFSDPSTTSNDENMLIIRGDLRAADIYFTEFNRIFNHYYFRSVVESAKRRKNGPKPQASLFLSETDEWLDKYKPGTLRSKRVAMFSAMKGF